MKHCLLPYTVTKYELMPVLLNLADHLKHNVVQLASLQSNIVQIQVPLSRDA